MGIESKHLRKHARLIFGSRWHRPLAWQSGISEAEIAAMDEGTTPVPNFVVEALVDAIREHVARLERVLDDLEPSRRSGRQ